ncbi:MAG: YbaB/EbfC family nucleoid-associated protein [Thalassobaculaceae bacterium]|nr:YbaB/EbfC family nucleoid-associated protein [Thalassobaculaceae bacterium]
MKNLGQMMKQAQEMQARMQEMQERMEQTEISGVAGGGMVTVTMTAKGSARAVKIDPALMDAGETEVLEDLLVAALNDARVKADELQSEQMKELTGGLPLPPGFKLPF